MKLMDHHDAPVRELMQRVIDVINGSNAALNTGYDIGGLLYLIFHYVLINGSCTYQQRDSSWSPYWYGVTDEFVLLADAMQMRPVEQ